MAWRFGILFSDTSYLEKKVDDFGVGLFVVYVASRACERETTV